MHIVLDHPLVRHCMTLLRNQETPSRLFRDTLSQVTTFLAYEAFRDLATVRRNVSTPVAQTHGDLVAERVVVVPILRSGIGMLDAVLDLLPDAVVGLLGLRRDENTALPKAYYSKIPPCWNDALAVVVDPMLATGGTICNAVDQLKVLGYRRIKCLHLLAAEPGLVRLEKAHPDVGIYLAALDAKLNEHFYIVPGLGDAGDRIYNTETNSALSKMMKRLEAKVLADGRIDMLEAGELLRMARPLVGLDEDFASFKAELENVRSDGVVDPIESDRIAKMISALADRADATSVFTCPACGRPVSLRTFEDGVALCPWCGHTCTL